MDPATSSLGVMPTSANLSSKTAPDHIATACFHNTFETTGWNNLHITTTDDKAIPLALRAYGAGFVEGLMTSDQIGAFNKTVSSLLEKDVDSVTQDGGSAIGAVDRVVRMSLIAWEELTGGDASTEPKDDIARQAWAALLQMRGIRDAYNILASQKSAPTLSMYQVLLMNMHAELPAIIDLYSRSEQAKILTSFLQTSSHTRRVDSRHQHALTDSSNVQAIGDEHVRRGGAVEWARWSSHMPRGSAIVRRIGPVGTPRDMISGHVTFGNYGEMLRIMKTYELNLGTLVGKVIMSSYPACISSTDDYFITDKGFVLMSTNLWLPERGEFAWPSKTNEGLPSFLRAVIATKLAVHPRMWAKTYGFLTGIAGAKQWLIADYSNVKDKQPIPNGTVFLVESLPRLMRLGDVSSNLESNGFFEAHGEPHFRQIRDIFGLSPKGEGSYKEHLGSALLDKAYTVDSLAMARSVLSEISPARTPSGSGIVQIPVTGRNDYSGRPVPEGGIDAKVTSRCLVRDVRMQAISGPPTNGDHPPFDWDAFNNGWPRFGLPQTWNFPWVNAAETGITSPVDDSLSTCESPNIAEEASGSAAAGPSISAADLSGSAI